MKKTVLRTPAKAAVGVAVAGGMLVAGCANQEQTGQGIGAIVGGVTGAIIGREAGGTEGAIVGGLAGALVGGLIGGEIGRQLDERDRELAAAATVEAIEASERANGGVATTEWSSDKNEGVSGSAKARAIPDPRPQSGGTVAQQQTTPPAAPPATPPAAPEAQASTEAQPQSQPASEPAEVAQASCYEVEEVAVVPGQGPISQTTTYCRENGKLVRVDG